MDGRSFQLYVTALIAWAIGWFTFSPHAPAQGAEPAETIVRNARVVTLDAQSSLAEALAIRDGRIIALGDEKSLLRHRGPETRMIDAGGRMLLPGLYDSHTHPTGAALSEFHRPLPVLKTIAEVLAHIQERAANQPEDSWVIVRFAFPTRLEEARFPTRAELDAAAPDHAVLYHAGPAGVVNSRALELSGVTKDTPDPPHGRIVRDEKTGEPTGMLRNAYSVLKGASEGDPAIPPEERRAAVKRLFALYNEHGITSVADRAGGRGELDLYRELHKAGELTLRVNVARSVSAGGSRAEIVERLESLPGDDGLGGPTGVGDAWVRVGPLKFFLDGGMLNGTAFMREPWPRGATYQVTEDDYRGLLFVDRDALRMFVQEAALRNWQVTAHCAGEAGMDELLAAYAFAHRQSSIRELRFCITHANFPSAENLELCREMGVCADVQPAWLWKDGTTLLKVLGERRVRWFQPYKSWLEWTTIGGGSDHMVKLDPLDSTNPWDPWLAIWVTLARQTERGDTLFPEERLTREQALRLYTVNNAYLNHEEQEKGTLEVGKLADLILIDRDVLTCPVDDVRDTKVLWTMVNGQIVFDRDNP